MRRVSKFLWIYVNVHLVIANSVIIFFVAPERQLCGGTTRTNGTLYRNPRFEYDICVCVCVFACDVTLTPAPFLLLCLVLIQNKWVICHFWKHIIIFKQTHEN